MQQRLDGLPMFGSAVEGEFEVLLGPYGTKVVHASLRLKGVLRLATILKIMAQCMLVQGILFYGLSQGEQMHRFRSQLP